MSLLHESVSEGKLLRLATSLEGDLVVNGGEELVTLVLLTKFLPLAVIKHGVKLLLGHVGDGVEGLETVELTNELLKAAHGGGGLELLATLRAGKEGSTIDSEVNVHVIIGVVCVDEATDGTLRDAAGAEPEGVHLELLVNKVEHLGEGSEGDEHVLIDVLLHIHLVEVGRGGELEEADLEGEHPAEQVTEDNVVPEGEEVMSLPEDGAGVAVVVGTERDIFY